MTRPIDEGDVAVAPGLHELQRVADRLVKVERPRFRGHQRLDRLVKVDMAADDATEDIALRQHATKPPVALADEHGIAGPRPLDGPQAIGEARARRYGH